MRQFEQKYRMKDGRTVLGETYFNEVLQDLDLRLDGVEGQGEEIDAAVAALQSAGLRRIDEFLAPAYENIAQLAELGFLNAVTDPDFEIVFDYETKPVLIAAGPQRDLFRPSPYLTFQAAGDYAKLAVGRTVDFDRETGVLLVEFVSLSPELFADPGPHRGVYVSAAAGSAIATLSAVRDALAAKTFVQGALATVAEGVETAERAIDATENQLGVFPAGSFPTTRPDGSALQVGDFLFDATAKVARVWDGATFAPTISTSAAGIRLEGGTFGASPSGVVTVNGGFSRVMVYRNGALLREGVGYTAASPTVTFANPTQGDSWFIWGFLALDATDFFTKEETSDEIEGAIGEATAPLKFADAASKATPVNADSLGLVDSADGSALKRLTWANLKTTLIAAFKASAAQVLALASEAVFATPKSLADAQAFVAINPAAMDLGTFVNGKVTLTANTTFAAPANAKAGVSGALRIAQDGTGSRTGTFATFWNFGPDGPPTLSTGANVVDWVFYQIDDGGTSAVCSFKAGA